MNKTFAMMVAVALLAVASPTMTTQAKDTELDPAAAMDSIFYEGEPTTDHPGSGGQALCHSDDSFTVVSVVGLNSYCTSGSHNPAFYSITHGPDLATMAASGFTGAVESIVFYETGERRWTCTFDAGSFTGCSGSGGWPGRAVEFCHDVWAYDATGPVTTPLVSGFAPGCPNGDAAHVVPGISTSSNSSPGGTGTPVAAWAAYVIHA